MYRYISTVMVTIDNMYMYMLCSAHRVVVGFYIAFSVVYPV